MPIQPHDTSPDDWTHRAAAALDVDRIRSHYEHRVASGAETDPMEVAIFDNPIYVDYGRYALQVEQYLPFFPREQLLIVSSEELRHEREATMRRVYDFVGVDPDFVAPTLLHEERHAGGQGDAPEEPGYRPSECEEDQCPEGRVAEAEQVVAGNGEEDDGGTDEAHGAHPRRQEHGVVLAVAVDVGAGGRV